ncbi:precorrin-3B synthase [Actinopolyspora biskrensis]|uniref:Precorrin-3B synthase n=1 Tax=Actinopolyspora biskrensis TaxID=1470178 RepID=A0A852YV68_9ACTN|nr:precorrin-3B synthase [Actinopolyspora biskrensis]NYH77960.1 precorrin-3B synthase [Actinopolyspora biskrensis]
MSEGFASERDRPDACPGALQVHPAADGGLARIRVPGGMLSTEQLRVLVTAAEELGNSTVELTSRANLQLRGVESPEELGRRIGAVGLLPSLTHERVRNIVASPGAGLDDPGWLSVPRAVRELDRGVCSAPRLAELSGRFLFTVDDGRGDVSRLRGDVGLLPLDVGTVAVLLGGNDSGVRVGPADAADAAVVAAEEFLAERDRQGGSVWRVAELDTPGNLAGTLRARTGTAEDTVVEVTPLSGVRRDQQEKPSVGVLARTRGEVALGLGAPLGRLSPAQMHSIIRAAEAASGAVRLTPWRTVVLPGVDEHEHQSWLSELHSCGLIVDPSSPFNGVTACAGDPGCAKSLADVHRDAAYSTARGAPVAPGDLPVHWVGCSRRCGRPRGPVVEVLAGSSGYRVSSGARGDEVTRVHDAGVETVAEAVEDARRSGAVAPAAGSHGGFGTGHVNSDQETTNEDDR